MEIIDYKPVPNLSIKMAVVTTLSEGTPTKVRVYIKTLESITTPETFIIDNNLEHNVISLAGLNEESSLSSFYLVSTVITYDHYKYILEASVS